MLSHTTQQMILQIQKCLSEQPVNKAWLFGSYSRGEETTNSDIDLLVEYTDSDSISLFTISRIATTLRKMTGKSVDLIERSQLLPFASPSAEQDKILIYEREKISEQLLIDTISSFFYCTNTVTVSTVVVVLVHMPSLVYQKTVSP